MRLTSTVSLGVSTAAVWILFVPSLLPAQQPCVSDAPCAVAAADPVNPAALPDAPTAQVDEQSGQLSGTVTDTNGDLVPGATVVLDDGDAADRQTLAANDNGAFSFAGVKPGLPYRVTITAPGFESWQSPVVTLAAGQFFTLTGIQIKLSGTVTSVTVYSSTEQIAIEQIRVAEQQRVLGIFPNFYVVYDAQNAVPLTTKLKYQLALRVTVDPVSFLAAAFLGGVNQAAETPNYRQGAAGYGERVGAVYADGFTDTVFGGAILPSLLHQDPRYFYQGTGTIRSRALHALAYPFICHGDNGKNQINYSSIGGDLISASLSNIYYPASNRGAGFVFENFAINTAEREVSTVVQEFIIRRLTPGARKQTQ
ncbi:MAG TPA: carboxypeptidase-like regulatory domain-containing protein [Terracidiphilus sp.]|jgi:hypothetical protein|nr:carboxypeptidase-like regulatory domain-containing protein [Terracidiphilus sp.]